MKQLTESQRNRDDLLSSFSGPNVSPVHDVSDEELVEAYLASRSPTDFEKLVKRYERELYTFLRRFVGDAQQAEDVFQATFLSVHLRIEQFERGRRFRPWLYAIASNKGIDSMRRNRRHSAVSLDAKSPRSDSDDTLVQRIEGNESSPEDRAIFNETGERVRAALQELNAPTQQLIQLAFYQGMKYADIAEVLHIPLGTVKSRVFTAIRKLNQIWMRTNESSENQDARD
jgi:RNA polymerase sigma-70 factor, ECF subfamily